MPEQTKNTTLYWDALTVEQRIQVVKVLQLHHARFGPRVKHKLIYGKWDNLTKSLQDELFQLGWHNALGLVD